MIFEKGLRITALSFVFSIFCLISFVGCTPYLKEGKDGEYDSSHIFLDSIAKTMTMISKSVYRIETVTIFQAGGELSTLKVAGMGFSIDNRHLLTARHVTSIDNYQVQTPFGTMVFPLSQEDKIRETTSVVFDDGSRDPVKVIYRDDDLDFALLETEKGVTPPICPIGDSNDFQVMNVVIVPANFQTGLSIRLGYVTQLDFIQYGENGGVAKRTENIFGISAVVSEGDSGSPILFSRDGKIELGGLVSFIVLPARGLGYGLKINPIVEKLRSDHESQKWNLPLVKNK